MKEKIEKLKEKIKAKPKLYKTLKVLKFLCNIGAYLIALFTILSLSIGGSCSNVDGKTLSSYKDLIPSKHVVSTSNGSNTWRYYSLNDLTSYSMCNNIWQYSVNYGNFLTQHNVVIGDTINDIYVVDGGDNSHTDYSGFEAFLRVTSYEISYAENDNRWVLNLKFNFANMNSSTAYFGLTFQYWRYKFSNELQIQVIPDVTNELTTAYTELLNRPFLIRVIDVPSVSHSSWWLYDVLGNGNFPITNENEIYDIGYNDGHSNGYNEGYASGSLGVSTNPFNLISNAFMGIAGFLNIQVIPGLTIGTMLFVPLIVLIIIVLFKMFRG